MDLNGQKISVIRMHTTVHVQSFGQIPAVVNCLDAQDKTGRSVTMTKVQDGVLIEFKTGQRVLIPMGNLQSIEFART